MDRATSSGHGQVAVLSRLIAMYANFGSAALYDSRKSMIMDQIISNLLLRKNEDLRQFLDINSTLLTESKRLLFRDSTTIVHTNSDKEQVKKVIRETRNKNKKAVRGSIHRITVRRFILTTKV